MLYRRPWFCALSIGLSVALFTASAGQPSDVLNDFGDVEIEKPAAKPAKDEKATPASPTLKKGLNWVLENQHSDGGWSSGSHGTDGSQASSDVATTAFTVLALTRSANGSGAYHSTVKRGIDFVINAIDTAPEGAKLNTPQGTQIQYKMGELVDTHLASLMLGEVAGTFDKETNRRINIALDKVVGKVQQAQRADGSFDANGWAPVLSSSIAAQSLNRAIELGVVVDDAVLAKSDDYQAGQADVSSGSFDASEGAGVELYAVATSMRGSSQIGGRTGKAAPTASMQKKAEEVAQVAKNRVSADSSGALMAGFGSIGGEEMVSYMMISDSLAEEGGKEWTNWETKVGDYLASIQNGDGSWVGHHCITSRAFTTAGAIMTLTAGNYVSLRENRTDG
ncbi:MAG: hypothetical protein HN348_01050 [Proteobacteria bacterium]|nr:hypothetical protein [Pseudomonadota bacterium]